MGGMILRVVINNDDTLIINMTVQEGRFRGIYRCSVWDAKKLTDD